MSRREQQTGGSNVRFGCATHRTPQGQRCEHCERQGALFGRGEAGRQHTRRGR